MVMPNIVETLPRIKRERASNSRGKSRVLVFFATSEHGHVSDEEFIPVYAKYSKWLKVDPSAELGHEWVVKGD